ncbi:MAG: LPS export ABC transporter periplasmic protein LptC [Mangrovimonas sp.]|nr:LPS export ABC transporter periplasmic protein LptC [Mangrovimonas sp.]HPF96913.1 LPS export ABC transporter periplasmic protein LptC [Mangrovimonas sp.]
MKILNCYTVKSTVAVIAATVLFSCQNNLSEVQKIGLSENEPIGVAENFNLKYTDSGRMTANLISPKMLDFSNREFNFIEFPEGAHLDIYDEENKKSTVVADYAIVYNKTGIIDMQGNVVLNTAEQDTLFAEQLFYDQEKEWLFTNKPVTFKTKQDLINGKGFDSNSKFTNAEVLEIDGSFTLDE